MAVALDGFASGSAGANSSSVSAGGLTTTNANDVIVAFVFTSGNSSSTVGSLSTAGVVWESNARTTKAVASTDFELWYGTAVATLPAAVTTAMFNASVGPSGFASVVVFGISGASTSIIVDANMSLPVSATSTGGLPLVMGVSTTTANDFVLAGVVVSNLGGSAETAGAGFSIVTSITGAGLYPETVQYGVVSGMLSSISVTFGTTTPNTWVMIVDAVIPGAQTGSVVFGGSGSLVSNATVAIALFNGAGSLTISAAIPGQSQIKFNGGGSLSVHATLAEVVLAKFNGFGSLSVQPTPRRFMASVIFGGTGSLSALFNFVFPQVLTYLNAFPAIPFPQHKVGQSRAVQSYRLPGAVQPVIPLPSRPQVVSFNDAFAAIPFPQHLLGQTRSVQSFIYSGAVQPVGQFYHTAVFSGTGSLTVDLTRIPGSSALFTGTGSLSATITSFGLGAFARFNGRGRMCIQAYLRLGSIGLGTNVVEAGTGPGSNTVIQGGLL